MGHGSTGLVQAHFFLLFLALVVRIASHFPAYSWVAAAWRQVSGIRLPSQRQLAYLAKVWSSVFCLTPLC